MSENLNRQFMILEFRFLENRAFLRFMSTSAFATYLVLRRHIWRSEKEHYMGLHRLHREEMLLASSLTRAKIADITGVAPDNISRHLTSMVSKGIIKRQRTGRQNIYVLGEWIDVNGDGSHRVEWYYLDGVYGVSKSDLMKSSGTTRRPASGLIRSNLSVQIRRKASDNNREGNRQENTVRGNGDLRTLPDLEQPHEKGEFVAGEIVEQLGDKHSLAFYRLVAAKVPEPIIRKTLSEIRVDGADDPAKVFTYRIKKYVAQTAQLT